MPGFMGLRGLTHKSTHDMDRQRREEHRQQSGRWNTETRSREKVQEILREQDGDMSAFEGGGVETPSDCSKLAREKVTRIMSSRVAVLSFDDTLLTVDGIFSSVHFHHLPVVDERGRIIGIISDRDFLRVVSPFFGTVNEQNRDKEIMNRKAGTIMTRNPVCAGIDASILDAVKLMTHNKISCLPIVKGEEKELLGIITWKDVVRLYCPHAFPKRTAESNRLKTGVNVNSERSETVRVKAKAAETVQMRAVQASDAKARPAAPARTTPAARSGDTQRITAPDAPLHVDKDDPLRPSSAGQAGSELAAKQLERMDRMSEK